MPDFTQIGDVVDALYAILSGPPGQHDWPLKDEIFHADARMLRTGVNEDGVSWIRIQSIAEYQASVSFSLSKIPYFEIELERRVEQFGNIAQVWSTYESRRSPEATHIERRGVNLIQMFRDHESRWRVTSIIWDNEREGVRLPE